MREQSELTRSILAYLQSRDFYRYLVGYVALLVLLEIPAGAAFAYVFVNRLNAERATWLQRGWENYLEQRWSIHYSKLTGYAWWNEPWQLARNGQFQKAVSLFEDDTSIPKEFDFFGVYLKKDAPLVAIVPAGQKKTLPDEQLLQHLFRERNLKAGESHLIARLSDGRLYLVSAMALCDYSGTPLIPGIELVAYDLEKFLKLTQSVLPVTLQVVPAKSNSSQLYFNLRLWTGKQLFVEVVPNRSFGSLVLSALAFFFLAQIVISIGLFALLAPRHARKHTDRLGAMLTGAEQLNIDLARKVEDLNRARMEIMASEVKYRHLIEGSSEIILSLDKDGKIVSANLAIEQQLGRKRESFTGMHLTDLVHASSGSMATIGKQLVLEKLSEVERSRQPVAFKVALSTRHNEPLELDLRLEAVHVDQHDTVIFAKASAILEDSLLKYTQAERKRYVFPNFITLGEQVGQRITANLVPYLTPSDYSAVRFGVREMILNAIEHGNLAISYEEKTAATGRGNYFAFMLARQADPRYRERRVTVSYSLRPDAVVYSIADEGDGFDHAAMLAKTPGEVNVAHLMHGRGIIMTRQIFDVIRYNRRGNRVFLVKRFNSQPTTG